MLPSTLLIPAFTQMLQALNGWLDKASAFQQALGQDSNALLSLRLAPDMYPLAAQIRFACFQAMEPLCRLAGQPVPDRFDRIRQDGVDAGNKPGSLQDARACLAETLAALSAIAPISVDEGSDAPITLTLPNDLIFDMTGDQYIRDWALPQFHFHLITAYAILRHHGVKLGKADYVPHMFAYARQVPERQD